jgi:type I restriction enzyme S subunit
LIVPFFLVNYLNSSVIRDRLVSLSITTTMTTISQVGLGTLEILAPPIDEQKLIIQKLKDMNDNFFSTVSKIQLEIDLLKEYRTALISEVVTGKIDVRNQ